MRAADYLTANGKAAWPSRLQLARMAARRKNAKPRRTRAARPSAASRAKLAAYRSKRDFTRTAEPSGQRRITAGARLRFVIQKHAARALHYDLRLELDGVFKSWAVTKGPSLDPSVKRLAVQVEDHPLDYGDFEGTIPKGQYGGGTVQLWDRGYWNPEGDGSAMQMLRGGNLKFHLDGKRLHGSWVLVRMRAARAGSQRDNWLLIKHRDPFAVRGEREAQESDRSVASGRSMAQIAAGAGEKPRPFMRKGQLGSDAVWSSNRSASAEPETRSAPAPKARTVAARTTARRKPGPQDVVMGVGISNPDKPLWPAAGKGDRTDHEAGSCALFRDHRQLDDRASSGPTVLHHSRARWHRSAALLPAPRDGGNLEPSDSGHRLRRSQTLPAD